MPFQGGLDDPANATLLFSVVAAILYLAMLRRPPSWRRTLAKAGSVTLLAWLAFSEGGPALLVAGLALGALGDAFLAQDGEKPFLMGLASFLAAHLAYVALFWLAGGGFAALAAEPWRAAAAVLLALFSAAMFLRLRPALPGEMVAPVAIYVAAILAMGVAALTLPAPLVIGGALAFMVSDTILAIEHFLPPAASPQRVWTGPAVWVLYWLAQASIAVGVLLAKA